LGAQRIEFNLSVDLTELSVENNFE